MVDAVAIGRTRKKFPNSSKSRLKILQVSVRRGLQERPVSEVYKKRTGAQDLRWTHLANNTTEKLSTFRDLG